MKNAPEQGKLQLTGAQRELVELARAWVDAEADEIAPGYESRHAYVAALGRVQGRMAALVKVVDELTGTEAAQ